MTQRPTSPSSDTEQAPGEPDHVLDRPIQEHLGKQLRTAYTALEEPPAFLGDTALPPVFDRQIRQLVNRETLHDRAVEAVRRALDDLELPTGGSSLRDR